MKGIDEYKYKKFEQKERKWKKLQQCKIQLVGIQSVNQSINQQTVRNYKGTREQASDPYKKHSSSEEIRRLLYWY